MAIEGLADCGQDAASEAVDTLAVVVRDGRLAADTRVAACKVLGWLGPDAKPASDALVDVVVGAGASSTAAGSAGGCGPGLDSTWPNCPILASRAAHDDQRRELLILLRQIGPEATDARRYLQAMWEQAPPAWTGHLPPGRLGPAPGRSGRGTACRLGVYLGSDREGAEGFAGSIAGEAAVHGQRGCGTRPSSASGRYATLATRAGSRPRKARMANGESRAMNSSRSRTRAYPSSFSPFWPSVRPVSAEQHRPTRQQHLLPICYLFVFKSKKKDSRQIAVSPFPHRVPEVGLEPTRPCETLDFERTHTPSRNFFQGFRL